MDFNIGETVTQKTKELLEKVILEFWYDTHMAIKKYVVESMYGRYESTANIRGCLSTLIRSLQVENKEDLSVKICDKKISYEELIQIFEKAQEHLYEEGILNYESAKSYHSVISGKMVEQ